MSDFAGVSTCEREVWIGSVALRCVAIATGCDAMRCEAVSACEAKRQERFLWLVFSVAPAGLGWSGPGHGRRRVQLRPWPWPGHGHGRAVAVSGAWPSLWVQMCILEYIVNSGANLLISYRMVLYIYNHI